MTSHIQNFVNQINNLFPKGETKIQTKQNTEVVWSQRVKTKNRLAVSMYKKEKNNSI